MSFILDLILEIFKTILWKQAPKQMQLKRITQKLTNKERITPSSIIISVGIIVSVILLLVKVSRPNIDWKIPFIPLMLALQIIFLLLAIKKRFKKV